MTPEVDVGESSDHESVVLASFENRYAAERMLASLGRDFRRTARKGDAAAFIISENADGSLKLTASRLVSASGLASAAIGVGAATMAGFIGIGSMLKGAESQAHAAHVRQSHVGAGAERAHELLSEAGPRAALALVRCSNEGVRQTVAARAADTSLASWDGSLEEFLASVDPSSEYDWVRAALGEPPSAGRP